MHGLCCPRQAVCVTAVCPRQAVYVTASHAAVGCVMLQYADIAVNTAVGRSLDCILLAIGFWEWIRKFPTCRTVGVTRPHLNGGQTIFRTGCKLPSKDRRRGRELAAPPPFMSLCGHRCTRPACWWGGNSICFSLVSTILYIYSAEVLCVLSACLIFWIFEQRLYFLPVLVSLKCQIKVMLIKIITLCNCAENTSYFPIPFYDNQPNSFIVYVKTFDWLA